MAPSAQIISVSKPVDSVENSKAPIVEKKDEIRSKDISKKETEEAKVEKGRQNTSIDKPEDDEVKG